MGASETGDLIVGIDAGGTGVRLVVCPRDASPAEDGNVAVWAGASAADGGPSPVAARVREAGFSPLAVRAVCAGITKYTRRGTVELWETELHSLFPGATTRIVPDFAIGFRGALLAGVGVTALAGTGSVIYGEDSVGGAVRVGGRGWEFGDEGSGAWLTTEAVRRTLRAADGVGKPGPLLDQVAAALGGSADAGVLGEQARNRAVAEGRGFLVPLLADAALAGDQEALDLFVGAAGWLAAQVRAAVERLQYAPGQPVSIGKVGGLWQIGEPLVGPFQTVMERFAERCHPSGFVLVEPDAAPVVGALRLARDLISPR